MSKPRKNISDCWATIRTNLRDWSTSMHPVSGVITDQQITNAAGVQALGSSPFTISDLSYLWIVFDVYENDLASVRVGETTEVKLNAYPDQKVTGRISNIGAILDSNIRTAKVRVKVRNPGMMRPACSPQQRSRL